MRKIIFQFLVVIILHALVSCGVENENEMVYSDNAEYESYDDTTLPHPFATALKEFMEDYDGIVRAYLATLDDNGTIGVLVRPTTRVMAFDYWYEEYVYIYRHFGTMFYMQDGELFRIDVPGFVAGRYNRVLSHHQTHTHIVEIIWKLEYGRWETSTRLEYFSDAYLFWLFNGYDNEFFDERNFVAEHLDECEITLELIAYRDARAEYAREKYGLVALQPPNFGHMHNTEDHTAQILAMTINSIPSLSAIN